MAKKRVDHKPEVSRWLTKISAYEREFAQWEMRVKKILEKYRDDKREFDTNNPAKFNILWSNVQTAIPAVFSRLPKPDVSRRHADNDPVGRVAALMLERALEFEIEHYTDYRSAMKNSVFDRFLGGRGTTWVRYEPHFKAAEKQEPEDGIEVTDEVEVEAEDETAEVLDYECCPVDYVHWRDFGHMPARTWEEVPAVWRRVYMSRQALVERFGEEIGNLIPLDTRPDKDTRTTNTDSENYQACIYEIWDKDSDSAIWISKSYGDVIDTREDPLKLENFFPCPKPLFATLTTDTLIPVPDFTMYQDQAYELDGLANTIDGLIKALKVKGVYDAAVPELRRLFTEAGNGDLISVDNWNAFAEKNGLKGAIDLIDLAPIAAALNAAYEAVERVKAQIYEVTGLADIIRGSSDPNETATAIKTKGQFGSMRLRAMQADVVQYATEILQIKAQIMCTQFSDDTLVQIGAVAELSQDDQQLVPQALQILRARPMRSFRIEVSTDSMIQMDELQEKADRMEFLHAAGGYLENLVQVSQSPFAAQIAPLSVAMMKFGVTGFKIGKALEGEFDATVDRIKEQIAQQAMQPPKPPPQVQAEMMKQQGRMQEIQAQAQVEAQRFQAEQAADQQQEAMRMQFKQQKLQMESAARQQDAQDDMRVEQFKQLMQAQQVAHQNELEAQRNALQAQQTANLEKQRMMHEEVMQRQQQMFELFLAKLNNAAKIEIAEVSKPSLLDQSQISEANQATQQNQARGIDGTA